MQLRRIAGLFLLATLSLLLPSGTPAQVAVGLSVHIGPPALPVYEQPICPGAGYIWTPGYWGYGPDGYFWVPGTWVLAPTPGFLWTPGYWGWGGGVYLWHAGYWGPHVGFYGGINYGFGYGGVGFVGGEWRGGVFHYNTAVTHVDTTVIRNTYVNKTVINNTNVSRVSFNGGTGGINARPTAAERSAENEHHVSATSAQTQHEQTARGDHSMLASVNHGRPAVAATSKPGEFHGAGAVAAHSASTNANRPTSNANRPSSATGASHNTASHSDRPPSARTNNASTSSNNRPNTSHTSNTNQSNANRPSAAHSSTNQSNANRPNTTHSSTNQSSANRPSASTNHSNTSRPPQTSHPQPSHQQHESGGHTGGR
jgi:hypothetical protein